VVLVWRPDRWGGSVTDLLATQQEREHLCVGFVSLAEALSFREPCVRIGGTSALVDWDTLY
jgi:DNA invertase Pin-like site-specific DNA recombinase